MPTLWQWQLTDHAAAPDRRAMHALLCRWLDTDHKAADKPWRWSLVKHRNGSAIEIGLLADDLVDRLLAAHAALSHGRGSVFTAALPQVAATAWADLAQDRLHSRDEQEWSFRFTSPVAFRRGGRFLPWPAPAPVFGSLRRSWRTFAAPHVGDLNLDLSLDPLVVTAIDGTSAVEQVVLKDGVSVHVGGFLGRVRYTVDGRVDTAALAQLVRLAPFCGVGSYTTRGFGAVRVLSRR
jgi:CRISPR-associated endoribonuclease Cas6